MVSRATAKSKGSQFEYDCHHSLQAKYGKNNVYLTKERGFQKQYDIHIQREDDFFAVECKRWKAISWNELGKLYQKLKDVAPDAARHILIFKSNFQPALVYEETLEMKWIRDFETVFHVPFEKHPSTRPKKKEVSENDLYNQS